MWQKVQRKKTLLKDYEGSGKSSVFVDKRIGEHNEELGEFDKAILRSQREMRVIVFRIDKSLLLFYSIIEDTWKTFCYLAIG